MIKRTIQKLMSPMIRTIYVHPRLRSLYWYVRSPFSSFAAYCHYKERTARDLLTNGEYRVLHGPYAGMAYTRHGSSVSLPALLGTYEMEIWPVIKSLADSRYDLIIDVGCAEGYHACGMAKITNTRVLAFDTMESARRDCAEMVAINHLSHLVTIKSYLSHEELGRHCDSGKVFVLCDIDFGEKELLDPEKVPSLAKADLLVETHGYREGGPEDTLGEITRRFENTHDIVVYRMYPRFAHHMWDFVEEGPEHRFAIGQVVDEPLCHAFFEARALNNWVWLKSRAR